MEGMVTIDPQDYRLINLPGAQLPPPRWVLNVGHLWVGDFQSQLELEEKFAEGFGSRQFLWSENDNVIFDPETRTLQALTLWVGDPVFGKSPFPMEMEVVQGQLQWQHDAKNWAIELATFTLYDTERDTLVGLPTKENPGTAASEAWEIAPGLELFFAADGSFLGWQLRNAAAALSDLSFFPPLAQKQETLSALHVYLEFLQEDNFELIEDEDLLMGQKILDFMAQLAPSAEPRMQVIHSMLEGVYTFNYS